MVCEPELGSLVGGKYRIVRPLGAGGMGAVYEAEHVLTGKRAAIKWLHPRAAGHEDLARAIHEARAASRVRHENVVDVYDVLQEGASIYLVMELLTGEPLSDRLAREPLPPHALIALLLPAMRGLAAAHAAGVVHRDVKPQNIFLAEEPGHAAPIAKLIDFGVSKMLEPELGLATHSGMTLGTPRYMSYEQLLGARDVDARTDVYAFGVILYEALTGGAPYGEAQSLGDLGVRFTTMSPTPPHVLAPDLPEGLSMLVMQALARDRDARLPSIDEFVRRIEPFASEARFLEEASAPRAARRGAAPGGLVHAARWRRALLVALLLAAGVAALLAEQRASRNDAASAPLVQGGGISTQPAADATAARAELGAEPPLSDDASVVPDVAAPSDPLPPRESPARRRTSRPMPRTAVAAPSTQPSDAPRPPPHADELHRAGHLQRQEF